MLDGITGNPFLKSKISAKILPLEPPIIVIKHKMVFLV